MSGKLEESLRVPEPSKDELECVVGMEMFKTRYKQHSSRQASVPHL